VPIRKDIPYSMNGTFPGWHKTFTHMEHHDDVLINSIAHPEYLLPSQWVPVLRDGPNRCSHCPKVWNKTYPILPRTQARSSGFESDWDFGSALSIMGKAKRKTRLADYDFKMAESNLCKTRGKEKESFKVSFSEEKVHQLLLKDNLPCPHSSCEKDPNFFERNGISHHFRVVHKCTFMDVNLQESLALRRRLHAKETIDINS